MNNYLYLAFEYKNETGGSHKMRYIISVPEFKSSSGSNGQCVVGLTSRPGGGGTRCRNAVYSNTTRVSFGVSNFVGSGGSDTNTSIPLAIYGMK